MATTKRSNPSDLTLRNLKKTRADIKLLAAVVKVISKRLSIVERLVR